MKQITADSKEFYDLMKYFESIAPKLLNIGSAGLTKEAKENWVKGFYYCDDNTNKAFKMFFSGTNFGIHLSKE